ncbi:MAG: 50S ribosomal protein L9 [Pseudomonadota bacterium]|nr:50S ribosomal protein L9 [Pseudomonadota bacterium]
MQIILLEKVVNVGNLGDVVKVKQGYARNYLIPQGKAKRATPENVASIEEKRSELESAANAKFEAAQGQAARLEGMKVEISQKAGVDGRLFGSVTNADVAEALKARGFEVEKSAVRMPSGPLKQIGEYPLAVALHADVHANVIVHVVGETAAG